MTGYIGNTFGHCYLVSGFRYCEFNGRNSTFHAFKRIVYSVNKSEFYVVFADSRSAVIFGNGVKFACGNNRNLNLARIFFTLDNRQFYSDFIYRDCKVGFKSRRFNNNFRHICREFIRALFFIGKSNLIRCNFFAFTARYGTGLNNFYSRKVKSLERRVNDFRRTCFYGYSVKRVSRKRQSKVGFRRFDVFVPVFDKHLSASVALVVFFHPRFNACRGSFPDLRVNVLVNARRFVFASRRRSALVAACVIEACNHRKRRRKTQNQSEQNCFNFHNFPPNGFY